MTMDSAKLGSRIREFRKRAGLTMASLALQLGVSQPAISQWESGKEIPGRDSLKKLSDLMHVPLETLVEEAMLQTNVEAGPALTSAVAAYATDVPVYGTVVGGHEGNFAFNGQVVDYVRRPPGVAKLRNIYALWVTGDSMAPWNSSGDLIYVTPVRPPVVGDHVVIELAGETEHEPGTAMVKLLAGKTPTHLKLKQYNPESEFTVPLARVKAVHKVLTLRDLLGV